MDAKSRIRSLLWFIEPQNRRCCEVVLDFLSDQKYAEAPGSSNNHQAWPGGYLDHVAETMAIAYTLFGALSMLRPLPFSLSDALLVMFLHDLEKPWKYSGVQMNKVERSSFRLERIREFGFDLSDIHLNALKYVEGENDDYTPGKRSMNPLAALCHMADVCSARLWPEDAHHSMSNMLPGSSAG
jgi:hypothetical protein